MKTNIFEWNYEIFLNETKTKIFFNETKNYFSAELWPVCQTGNSEETDAKTREFLRQVSCDWWRAGHVTTSSPLIGGQVVEILLDHITVQNDRSTKILDFHNPEQLKEVIDFAIPEEPLNLDQLLVDCKDTLKYQVKTGEGRNIFIVSRQCSVTVNIFSVLNAIVITETTISLRAPGRFEIK